MFIKKICLTFFCLFTVFTSVNVISQGAPSMWHRPSNDSARGDIVHRQVLVPYDTLYTYYSAINWNAGEDGGGYLGLQAHPDGHNFIFSIWDPSNRQAITAPYTYPGTRVKKFGGEGTGLKTMNYTIGWANNQWVTTTVRRWDHNNHTRFGFWVKRNNNWFHVATLNFPMPNITLSSSNSAFLEDWNGTGQNKRRFHIGNSWKRQLNGQWRSYTDGNLTANAPQNNKYDNKYNGDVRANYFFLESGGNSSPNSKWKTGNVRHLAVTRAFPATPVDAVIDFSIIHVNTSSISWNVPSSSVPQFKQTIKINGSQVASTISPERSSALISASSGDRVELILEDILGRTKSLSRTIGK